MRATDAPEDLIAFPVQRAALRDMPARDPRGLLKGDAPSRGG